MFLSVPFITPGSGMEGVWLHFQWISCVATSSLTKNCVKIYHVWTDPIPWSLPRYPQQSSDYHLQLSSSPVASDMDNDGSLTTKVGGSSILQGDDALEGSLAEAPSGSQRSHGMFSSSSDGDEPPVILGLELQLLLDNFQRLKMTFMVRCKYPVCSILVGPLQEVTCPP